MISENLVEMYILYTMFSAGKFEVNTKPNSYKKICKRSFGNKKKCITKYGLSKTMIKWPLEKQRPLIFVYQRFVRKECIGSRKYVLSHLMSNNYTF